MPSPLRPSARASAALGLAADGQLPSGVKCFFTLAQLECLKELSGVPRAGGAFLLELPHDVDDLDSALEAMDRARELLTSVGAELRWALIECSREQLCLPRGRLKDCGFAWLLHDPLTARCFFVLYF